MATEEEITGSGAGGESTPAESQQPIEPEVKKTTGGNTFFDQLAETAANTPKQSYGAPEPDNTGEQSSQSSEENANGGASDEGSGASSNGNGWTDDRIQAEAKMHVVFFDFAASRGLALYSGDKPEKYSATPSEQDNLAKALADWYKTMEAPPKLPPWLMVAGLVVFIYGPKFMDARSKKMADKKAKAKKPGTVTVETPAQTKGPKSAQQREQRSTPGEEIAQSVPFKVVQNDEKKPE